MRLPDNFWVDDVQDYGLLQLQLDECSQDLGRVARRAAAGVVGVVGQHDRELAASLAFLYGFKHRYRSRCPALTIRPDPITQFISRRASQCWVVVGNSNDTRSHVGNVGPGKAGRDGNRENPSSRFQLVYS